jgi:hypothetical protein
MFRYNAAGSHTFTAAGDDAHVSIDFKRPLEAETAVRSSQPRASEFAGGIGEMN